MYGRGEEMRKKTLIVLLVALLLLGETISLLASEGTTLPEDSEESYGHSNSEISAYPLPDSQSTLNGGGNGGGNPG
jgi:hypothetical protein